MKVALSGTPGTGKSSAAKILAEKGYDIIDINKLVFDHKWDLGFDDDYQSTIADLAKLNAHLAEYPEDSKIHIIEGHLSHLLDLDMAVVLRTYPDKLKERLSGHDYSDEKINENIEAEALAVITTEAMERFANIYEVDTTVLSIEETADVIERIINDPDFAQEYTPGKFNWMEAVL